MSKKSKESVGGFGLFIVLFFGYNFLVSLVRKFVPRVGPESLASELMVNSFTIPLGLVLVPVLFFCIKRAKQSKRIGDGKLSKWRGWALFLALVEIACIVSLPFGSFAPVRDLFSGSEVINVKGCQNYFTEKEEDGWGSRKENRHTRSSRDARYVYFTSFDLITDENKAINVKFTDNRRNSEFYAPVVKFCKNKGTSAVMSRYPHTGIIKEFTVKEK
ncbi:MAG: hypothetical protein HXK05_05290 [Actinomyces graevenitzii]|uniref:Uncharacterized protein n=1 Tax=Actinomyces graevenitzii TaxID=55565 RepID=A0A9E7ARH7_9ACTO|nr:hypothetical protein [Actinomyces graevenitzii]UQF80352.1 MAG: hypothetical protein M3I41_03535 [Actinomyces graevenitzii]